MEPLLVTSLKKQVVYCRPLKRGREQANRMLTYLYRLMIDLKTKTKEIHSSCCSFLLFLLLILFFLFFNFSNIFFNFIRAQYLKGSDENTINWSVSNIT